MGWTLGIKSRIFHVLYKHSTIEQINMAVPGNFEIQNCCMAYLAVVIPWNPKTEESQISEAQTSFNSTNVHIGQLLLK